MTAAEESIGCDLVIIGAGLVGLATAIQILRREPALAVVVVEAESAAGRHQSSHNSGVVHAGVYYAPGSLKADLCREGRAELIELAAEHGIPYRAGGKVIVAASATDLEPLRRLHERALANGLRGVRAIEARELLELEPHARGLAALHVPETGVIDFGAVAIGYQTEVERLGGIVRTGWPATEIADRHGHWEVRSPRGAIRARFLVACAGLFADRALELAGERDREHRIVPFRGSYFRLSPVRSELVRSMIYPVPDPSLPFLGVHFTRGIDGDVHVGPNAMPSLGRSGDGRRSLGWRELARAMAFPGTKRLVLSHARAAAGELQRDISRTAFLRAARSYLPELEAADLRPGGSGIRAQCVTRGGTLVDDFLFHGGPRSLHVLNAPSPAATASLAIGRVIAERVLPARVGGTLRG